MAKMIRRKSMAILLTLAMVIGFLPALTLPAKAAGTPYAFSGLGSIDGSGYYPVGTYFKVGNVDGTGVYTACPSAANQAGSNTAFYPSDSVATSNFSYPYTIYIKANGTSCKTFTFTDMGLSAYNVPSYTYRFTSFVITFYDAYGNPIGSSDSFSNTGAISKTSVSLLSSITSHGVWNVPGVATIKIDFYIVFDEDTANCAANLAFENIIADNVSDKIPPTFTSGDTANFAENATGAAYTATATPTEGGTVTYSLSGGADQSLFNINSSTGAVTFIGSPDYENPTDSDKNNVYNITVKAAESGGGEATQDVAITVTDANDVNFSITDNDGGISSGGIADNEITRTMSVTGGGTVAVSFSTFSEGDPYTNVYAAGGDKTGWPSGLYNYTGNSSNVKLQISVPAGYTFDLSSFKFVTESPGVTKIDVGTSDNLAEYGSFTVTQDGSKGYTLVKPTSVNDVTSVVLSASGYTLFQDIEITDIQKTAVNTAPFTRDITSFLQLGAGATAMTASGTVATSQTDNITLEAWIYLENTTGTHGVLFNGDGGSSGYGIYLGYPNEATVSVLMGNVGWIYCSSGDSYDAAKNAVLTAGKWMHIAVTRKTSDGDTIGWKIYINGHPMATQFIPNPGVTSATPGSMNGNSKVQIGDGTAGLSVSEARIWNRALTQSEIQANMSGTVAADAADLAGYWKLNDGSGATTVKDIQANKTALDLPITGTYAWVASTAGITAEDTPISGRLAGGDIETSVTYAKATDPAHGTVTVTAADGSYTYTPAANYNGSDSFTFVTNDKSADSAPRTVSITVTAVNDAPTITSDATASFAENGTGTVYTATGTDPESDTITWSIGGTDEDLFNINSSSGALTFKTAPNYESPADSDTNNSYIVEIQASDGTATSTKTVTVTVTNVNEAPTGIALSSSSVNENTASGTAVGTLSATDVDSADTFTYTLVSGTGDTDNASFTIDGSSLKLAVSPDYETKSSYSIRIQTKDAAGATYSEAFTITVTDVNEAPSITVPGSITVTEDVATALTGISFADADAGNASVTATMSVGSGTLAATTDSNVTVGGSATALTLTGSITNINAFIAAGKVTFTTASDATANVTLTVAIDDGGNTGAGGAKTDSDTVTLSVTAVNDAPTITSGDSASFAENGTGTVYTATYTDPDAGDTITWSVSGTDADLFAIDSGTGTLTFKTAPNYESPADSNKDNVYNVTVTATDNGTGALTATKDVAITVTDVNEAPTDIALSNSSVSENTASGTAVGTLSATDPDSGNTFTYALATGTDGDDNGSFTIVENTLKTNAVFDYDVKQSYKIRVRTTDQNGLYFEEAFTISITEINVAPTGISLSSSSVAENTAIGTAIGTLSTTDDNASDTFTYTLVSGTGDTDNGSFTIEGSSLKLAVSPDYETKSSYSIRIQTKDTAGATYSEAFTITVTDVNEAPSITSGDSASFAENGTGTVYTATGSDEDGNTITWSISGGDAALFAIDSSTGALTFKTAPNYEAPTDSGTNNVYNITVTATDNGAGTLTATKNVAITVTNVNEAPSVTSGNSESVSENTTGTAYTAAGTDPDAGDTITWSLGGTDMALFNIDSDGKVTFISAPDYEDKKDVGTDNVYNIIVTATDGGSLTASKDVAITVTNVNEAPTISTGAAVSITEGGTTAFTAAATDPEGSSITWSISGGDDAALFSIAGNGKVTFKAAPSFSAPTDSDKNNEYILEITATDDGSLSSAKNVTVTVTQKASEGGGSSTPTTTPTVVEVNGQKQDAGTSATSTNSSGQTVTTVTVDSNKLENILTSESAGATVTIPFTGNPDVAAGTLTGAMVKSMENKDATLVVQTDSGTYTLPASEINIDAVSQQLGTSVSLSDIAVTVSIAKPSASMTQVVENAAQDGGYTIMVPAVDYTITCTHGDQTVSVSSFNAYVERTIAIPDGVDPTKITTGVVVEPDGTTHHVPTKVTVINGKYYAVINSLTNSTYSVVWNPVEFSDVTNHWAKDAINDMGSRMVVTGVGNNNYAPDRDMTRAEFATIMVRALGLEPGTGAAGFGDVAAIDWYSGYIKTAASYGIIKGYEDGNFGPEDTITREQAMTMIARAMAITKLSAGLTDGEAGRLLSAFSDGEAASAYARESIAACLKTGIVSGTSETTVSPTADITRAEVAVMVQRLLQKSGLI